MKPPEYLPGEVECLDALVDLYPDPHPGWSREEWELSRDAAIGDMVEFHRRLIFAEGEPPQFVSDEYVLFMAIQHQIQSGELTEVSLHQALGRSPRYLLRYYERFPEKRGGC